MRFALTAALFCMAGIAAAAQTVPMPGSHAGAARRQDPLLRKTWAPRASEVEASTDWRIEAGEARATERDLMSSLHNATTWKLSSDKLQTLAAGCMSDECRGAASVHIINH